MSITRVKLLYGAISIPGQPMRTRGQTCLLPEDQALELVARFPDKYLIVRESKPKIKDKKDGDNL